MNLNYGLEKNRQHYDYDTLYLKFFYVVYELMSCFHLLLLFNNLALLVILLDINILE